MDIPLPQLDTAVLDRREAAACQKQSAMRATFGIGVTEEAQELFDQLHKT